MTQLPATLLWSCTSLTEHLFVVCVRDREQWRACTANLALIKAEEATGYEQIRGVNVNCWNKVKRVKAVYRRFLRWLPRCYRKQISPPSGTSDHARRERPVFLVASRKFHQLRTPWQPDARSTRTSAGCSLPLLHNHTGCCCELLRDRRLDTRLIE